MLNLTLEVVGQIKRTQLDGDWRTNKKDRLSIM